MSLNIPKYKKQNWVLYLELQNLKLKTELDIILDKVFQTAKPIGELYNLSSLGVYGSKKSICLEFIFERLHLFITSIPYNKIAKLDSKACKCLVNKIIHSLNLAKQRVQERKTLRLCTS